ncbi:hypothetical protein [Fodinicola feengrottensis]|nr:hypothetical protein [Fodinicola feengrottensis]
MIVRMWEVMTFPEAYAEVLSWMCEVAAVELERHPGCFGCEILSSTDRRIVAISHWREEPADPPAPPSHLISSGPNTYDFFSVER